MGHLLNHDNLGAVQKTVYLTATVVSTDSALDTMEFTGVGPCPDASAVPVFYHCSDDAELRDNGALEGATGAFFEDDEVVVQCEIDASGVYKPCYVIGFVDKPKNCEIACIDVTEDNLTEDISGRLVYTLEQSSTPNHPDRWTESSVVTFSSAGLFISSFDINYSLMPGEGPPFQDLNNYYNIGTWTIPSVTVEEEGWYLLEYNYTITPEVSTVTLTPHDNNGYCETVLKCYDESCCVHFNHKWTSNTEGDWHSGGEECDGSLCGNRSECVELSAGDTDIVIEVTSSNFSLIQLMYDGLYYSSAIVMSGGKIEFSGIKLRRITSNVVDPCDRGEQVCVTAPCSF